MGVTLKAVVGVVMLAGTMSLNQIVANQAGTFADWYMFQDADDWSAADRLERLLAHAASTGAELVGSDYVMMGADTGLATPYVFPPNVVSLTKLSE